MPQRDIAIVLILGTLAGGWRYLIPIGGIAFRIGFPFTAKSKPDRSSIMQRFDIFLAKRWFQKTYAEELAKEGMYLYGILRVCASYCANALYKK